jgi:hypothetical protein
MLMSLTPEQREAVRKAGEGPVRLLDPETNRTYYLVAEAPSHSVAEATPLLLGRGVPEGIARSRSAFLRDLPQLLQLRRGKKLRVAYHGEERMAFGSTETDLYQECYRRGLKEEEFSVGQLVYHPRDDEAEEIEPGGHEVDYIEPNS